MHGAIWFSYNFPSLVLVSSPFPLPHFTSWRADIDCFVSGGSSIPAGCLSCPVMWRLAIVVTEPIVLSRYRCGQDLSRGKWSSVGHRLQDLFAKDKWCVDRFVQCHIILFQKYHSTKHFQSFSNYNSNCVIFFLHHRISTLLLKPNMYLKRKK